MDLKSSSPRQSGWALRRLDSDAADLSGKWPVEDASSGSWFVDVVRAAWRRRVLVVGWVIAGMLPILAWSFLRPSGYTVEQSLLFARALGDDDAAQLLTFAHSSELAMRASEGAGLVGQLAEVEAVLEGSRTLSVAVTHRSRGVAGRAVESAVDLLQERSPVSFRPQGFSSAQAKRLSRERLIFLAAGGVLGLLFAVMIAAMLDRRARRVTSAAELAQITGFPVVILDEETPTHVS